MQPVPPPLLELAKRLRLLRLQQWPDVKLTQLELAQALGDGTPLAPATVSSWESPTSPKLPQRHRLVAYAKFFATRRSVEQDPPAMVSLTSFSDEERKAYRKLEAELLGLRESARKPTLSEQVSVRRSWHFGDAGPATLVCPRLPEAEISPLARQSNANYTELLSYADLDAMVELHGHIRAENPAMDVFFKSAPDVKPDDLSGHVILIGGIGWNEITQRLSAMARLPVRQVSDPAVDSGEIFVTEIDGEDRKFLPRWQDDSRGSLIEDVGLLARVPNPLNSNRTLTICNGIHSRGVYGAVRTLTDARLRDSNEQYIADNFGYPENFVILMSVQVIEERTMTPDFNNPDVVLCKWPEGGPR